MGKLKSFLSDEEFDKYLADLKEKGRIYSAKYSLTLSDKKKKEYKNNAKKARKENLEAERAKDRKYFKIYCDKNRDDWNKYQREWRKNRKDKKGGGQ